MSPAVGETLDITANSTIQGLEARISISSEGIQQRVENLETGYSTLINTYADKWNAMVTSGANGNFNSLFEQQASKITTFVRNDEFQSKFVQEAKNITLEANQININGATFDSTGKLTLTAGNLGGWQVASQQLYAGSGAYRVGMQSTPTSGSVSFYAGSETPTNAPFRVTNTGDVYASSFQGIGLLDARQGKVGHWHIYPIDEETYKKWAVTEYNPTSYDSSKFGDIWTSGTWQTNAYSSPMTFTVGLHATTQNNPGFVYYGGFMARNPSLYCGIDFVGDIITGNIDEVSYFTDDGSLGLDFTTDYNYAVMLNNGHIYASNAFHTVKKNSNGDVLSTQLQIDTRFDGGAISFGRNQTWKSAILLKDGAVDIYGTLACADGYNKLRIIDTEQFGSIGMTAYETADPIFADIGEGLISSNGETRIYIDPIFAETIVLTDVYHVFLQKYNDGECYVAERNPSYFIVKGTPGLKFAWEIKGKQKDFDQNRLFRYGMLQGNGSVGNRNYENEYQRIKSSTDYGALASDYLEDTINN